MQNLFKPELSRLLRKHRKRAVKGFTASEYAGHQHIRLFLQPRKAVDVNFGKLQPDKRYYVSVEHDDDIIQKLSDSLIGEILLDGQALSEREAVAIGVRYSKSHGGHIHFGGGQYDRGKILKKDTFFLPPHNSMTLRISLKINRALNIDHLKLYPENRPFPESARGTIFNETVMALQSAVEKCEARSQLLESRLNKTNFYVNNMRKTLSNRDRSDPNPDKFSSGTKYDTSLSCAYILDEMSEQSWSDSFELHKVLPDDQANSNKIEKADFLFLESCWNGNGGAWANAFVSDGLRHRNSKALFRLIGEAKSAEKPIVFWNKEDPMHFDRYLPIAEHATHILTTDSECVDNYRRNVPDAKVAPLRFGSNASLFNPAGRNKSPGSVCFAGAYYGKNHDERARQMNFALPAIIEFNGTIYDRYSHLGNSRYAFPDEYEDYIKPSVPYEDMIDIYRSYRAFLNVNTITDSPTMLSRRVYELLACGTPVVSAPSRAIEEQFSGIVMTGSNEKQIIEAVEKLLTDREHAQRTSVRGIREIFTNHLYKHRAREIESHLFGIESVDDRPLVSVIIASCRAENVSRVIENLERQNYPRMEVIYAITPEFSEGDINRLSAVSERCSNVERAVILKCSREATLGRCLNAAVSASSGQYIAKVDDDNFYFENYLTDLMLPFEFGDYDIVGKRSYFCYLEGSDKIVWHYPSDTHCETDFVSGDAMIMRRRVFDRAAFPNKRVGEDSHLLREVKKYGGKIYSADQFNFLKFRSADLDNHTWKVDEQWYLERTKHFSDGLRIKMVTV